MTQSASPGRARHEVEEVAHDRQRQLPGVPASWIAPVFCIYRDSILTDALAGFTKVGTLETWVGSLDTIALVRNALMHGVSTVSPELATACKKLNAILFDVKEGEPLDIKLYHLQGVDCFCVQPLSGLNLSMIELHTAKLKAKKCRPTRSSKGNEASHAETDWRLRQLRRERRT